MAGLPVAHYQGHMRDEDEVEVETMRQMELQGPGVPEDGYTWRKYGQKFIKRISKNRSYFKCQSGECQAKKQVEWSTSDSSVKVVYDGTHRHPPPNSSAATDAAEQPPATMNQYNLLYQVFGSSFPLTQG